MSHDRVHLSQISTAAALWGTTGVAVALLGETTTLTPVAIGFYRLAISAVVLLTGARGVVRLFRVSPARVTVTGVFLGGYQALYFIAVANAGVGVATMVSLGIAPVGLTAWDALRARRRPDLRTMVIVAAALTGLVLISAQPAGGAPRPFLGLVAAIGSGLGYAVSALLSRNLSSRGEATSLTAATSAVGALALLPLAATGGGLRFAVSPGAVALLIYLGVVTTAVAYALFYAGLRGVEGSVAAVLTLIEPLTAALLAAVILGESLSTAAIAGSALLLSAVAVLYAKPSRPPVAKSAGRRSGRSARSRFVPTTAPSPTSRAPGCADC